MVQVLRFGAAQSEPSDRAADFELTKSVAEFFEYIRGVDDGEIRCFEVHHGLPFSMEIVCRISRGVPDSKGSMLELFEFKRAWTVVSSCGLGGTAS